MPRRNEYQTRQGTQLLDCLKAHAGRHITAAELIQALAAEGTPMGAATVYRRLEKLEAQGLVRRYALDDRGSACWQYIDPETEASDCRAHFHLKCTVCGELFHLNCDHLHEIAAHVQADHGFAIDPSRTVFYGVCGTCSGKENGNGNSERSV